MSIGVNLRALRIAAGLSGNELGGRAGVPQSTVSNIENGKVVDPTVSTASKLAFVLGVSIEELFGEVSVTPRPLSQRLTASESMLETDRRISELATAFTHFEERLAALEEHAHPKRDTPMAAEARRAPATKPPKKRPR